jgi:cold shock CspA family protein
MAKRPKKESNHKLPGGKPPVSKYARKQRLRLEAAKSAPPEAPPVSIEKVLILKPGQRSGIVDALLHGYGFLSQDHDPRRICNAFFHKSECGGRFETMRVGERVSYYVTEGDRGPVASEVRKIS